MLARIIDNWLTSIGEVGYQAAFTHLLISEGYSVVRAPVHHPYEHGKDLVALSPEGKLCAFQLKGGDVSKSQLDIRQLDSAVRTGIGHPGVEPPRRPDRVVLVTTGRISAPASDEIRAMNDANRTDGLPVVETVERDALVGRHLAAHGTYFPSHPVDLRDFLQLALADGVGMLPVREFAAQLWNTIQPPDKGRKLHDAKRALGSAALMTAYTLGPWTASENHLGVAEGWLVFAMSAMRCAELEDLPDEYWLPVFEVARDQARRSLDLLIDEAAGREDLIVPDLAEGLVYPVRSLVVCGYASAYWLSERTLDAGDSVLEGRVREILMREVQYLRIPGEAGTPHLVAIATALQVLGELVQASSLVIDGIRGICALNVEGQDGVPDPYHPLSEVLLESVGGDTGLQDESCLGQAYTMHVLLDWLIRRDLRPIVAKLWRGASRLTFCETKVSAPAFVLAHDDPDATHEAWIPAAPESWARLKGLATVAPEICLPQRLWQHPEMIPYLSLIYPHRLTRVTGIAFDYVSVGLGAISFADAVNDQDDDG